MGPVSDARRGQAALEFITTYGWAMLVIIVMIGAIAYFGVLKPDTLIPGQCVVEHDFSCQDWQIRGDTVNAVLKQGIGKTIYLDSVQCTYDSVPSVTVSGTVTGKALPGAAWSPRESVEIACVFSGGELAALKDSKAKVAYNLSYRQSTTGFTRIAEGQIIEQVQ
jgi:hypothetical protein